jgi:hypothetical protein
MSNQNHTLRAYILEDLLKPWKSCVEQAAQSLNVEIDWSQVSDDKLMELYRSGRQPPEAVNILSSTLTK